MESQQLIINNERDRRAAEWLVSKVGQDAVDAAIVGLAGNRRAYVSNIAKILGVEIPNQVVVTPPSEAKKRLSDLRAMLDEKQKGN